MWQASLSTSTAAFLRYPHHDGTKIRSGVRLRQVTNSGADLCMHRRPSSSRFATAVRLVTSKCFLENALIIPLTTGRREEELGTCSDLGAGNQAPTNGIAVGRRMGFGHRFRDNQERPGSPMQRALSVRYVH